MNNFLKAILTGLGLAALAYFISREIIISRKAKLYDVKIIAEVYPDTSTGKSSDQIFNEVPVILRQRLEAAGYTTIVKTAPANLLDIIIRGVDDTILSHDMVNGSGNLEFWEVYTLSELKDNFNAANEVAKKILNPVVSPPPPKPKRDSGQTPRLVDLMQEEEETAATLDRNLSLLISFYEYESSYIGIVKAKDTASLDSLLRLPEFLDKFPADTRFYYGSVPVDKKNPEQFPLYAIRTYGEKKARLGSADISDAKTTHDRIGNPVVNFYFRERGTKVWQEMTRNNINRFIAMVFNHSVMFAPQVNGEIEGGVSTISGGLDARETKALAAKLKGGELPADIHINSQQAITEKRDAGWLPLLIALLTFVLSAGIAYWIFNLLKNN